MHSDEPPAIEAQGVWFGYRPNSWILRDVSLAVPPRGLVGITGPSGSGKTTLLKVLGGFLRPQRGRVTLHGRQLKHQPGREQRRRVGYIPQQLGLVRGLTALENATMGALGRMGGLTSILGLVPESEVRLAGSWLERLGIADKAAERAFKLSGGQRQRVAIARTLVQKPEVVLADEFVSGLDQERAIEIIELLKEIGQEAGIGFVFTMHEPDLMERFATQIVALEDGAVAGVRSPAQPSPA